MSKKRPKILGLTADDMANSFSLVGEGYLSAFQCEHECFLGLIAENEPVEALDSFRRMASYLNGAADDCEDWLRRTNC